MLRGAITGPTKGKGTYMANDKTPEEKGREAFEAKRTTLRLMATDVEFRKLTVQNAIMVGEARHEAAIVDFASGQATQRAISAYKVKRAVADFAKGEGRKANGEALDAPKLPDGPVATGKPENVKAAPKSA